MTIVDAWIALWLLAVGLLASAGLVRLVRAAASWWRGRRPLGPVASPAIVAGVPRPSLRTRLRRARQVPTRMARGLWLRLGWTTFKRSALIDAYNAGQNVGRDAATARRDSEADLRAPSPA